MKKLGMRIYSVLMIIGIIMISRKPEVTSYVIYLICNFGILALIKDYKNSNLSSAILVVILSIIRLCCIPLLLIEHGMATNFLGGTSNYGFNDYILYIEIWGKGILALYSLVAVKTD